MWWALFKNDPCHWLPSINERFLVDQLIAANDSTFKKQLDMYKYPTRFSQVISLDARTQAENHLAELENLLTQNLFLISNRVSIVDIALFPFIRQFANVDLIWFQMSPYKKLRIWLENLTQTPIFKCAMQKFDIWAEKS